MAKYYIIDTDINNAKELAEKRFNLKNGIYDNDGNCLSLKEHKRIAYMEISKPRCFGTYDSICKDGLCFYNNGIFDNMRNECIKETKALAEWYKIEDNFKKVFDVWEEELNECYPPWICVQKKGDKGRRKIWSIDPSMGKGFVEDYCRNINEIYNEGRLDAVNEFLLPLREVIKKVRSIDTLSPEEVLVLKKDIKKLPSSVFLRAMDKKEIAIYKKGKK